MPKNNHAETESAPSHPTSKPKLRLGLLLILVLGLILSSFFALKQYVHTPVNDQKNCNQQNGVATKQLRGGEVELTVEVADSRPDQVKGLSGRSCLGDGAGMLFVYGDASTERCFWMKDMNFAIDMIWLDKDRQAVSIQSNVPPDSYPKSFCPDKPAQYVLEVKSGFAKQSGWLVGTKFEF